MNETESDIALERQISHKEISRWENEGGSISDEVLKIHLNNRTEVPIPFGQTLLLGSKGGGTPKWTRLELFLVLLECPMPSWGLPLNLSQSLSLNLPVFLSITYLRDHTHTPDHF